MSYHVLVPDNVDQKAIDLLEAAQEITVQASGSMSREQTLAAVPTADALVIRSSTTADAELLGAATKLKAIARAGVGVDNIDVSQATAQGIVVMNTPDGNTISTAEFTFGLMLSLARHIPRSHGYMSEGRWDRKVFKGVELRGKTLGIIGFGRIGRAIAKRALAFEMEVITADPYIAEDVARDFGVSLVDLDTLYARSDFITLHTVATPETKEMINTESIARMKPGVRLINAARGALIDDEALALALKSGQVGGAAVDVYHDEPPPTEHPLIGLQNVIHTPHLAASTSDAQVNVGIDAAQQIIDGLLRSDWRNVINPDVLK
jgi:D-3-phosphoglycerate dehydrogenase / 2-oxoglutarate reductase